MARKRTAATTWRNRIVKHGEQPADQFLANPDNWRIHPAGQQEALRRVIGVEVGWVQSVIVNMRTSSKWPPGQRNVETMLDGHERVQLALRKDDKEPVPTVWVDLDPDEERLVLATFDPIGQLAVEDHGKLGELEGILQERHSDLLDLVATGVLPDGDGVPPKKKAKGLRHTVHACTCCADGKCKDPECGCFREQEP
jgi:hypothetical protein